MAKDPGSLLGYSPCFYFCCFKKPSSSDFPADDVAPADNPDEHENGAIITEQCDNYGATEEAEQASWSELADKYSQDREEEDEEEEVKVVKDDSRKVSLLQMSRQASQEDQLQMSRQASQEDQLPSAPPMSEEEAVLSELDTNLASETVVSSDSGPIEDDLQIDSEDDLDDVSSEPYTAMVLPSRDITIPLISLDVPKKEPELEPPDCESSLDCESSITPTPDTVIYVEEEVPAEEEKKHPVPPALPDVTIDDVTEAEDPPAPHYEQSSMQSYKMASEDSGIVVEQGPVVKTKDKKNKKNKLFSKSAVFSDGDEPGSNLSASNYELNAQSTTSLNSNKKKKFFKFKKLRFKKKKNKGEVPDSDIELSKSTPSLAQMSDASDLSVQSRYSASVMLASLDDLSDEDIARE